MRSTFTFGIYPGGIAGTDSHTELTSAKPDIPLQIERALNLLQPAGTEFWVRSYMSYSGNGQSKNHTPRDPEQYVTRHRRLDLVLGFHSLLKDVEQYELFVRSQIRRFKGSLAKIQITEEPNLCGVPAVDGDIPGVKEALIRGVVAAREEIDKLKLQVLVGFNAVPNFDTDANFWREIAAMAPPEFYQSLNYVGLDFFPDVFRSVSLQDIPVAVKAVLNQFRNANMKEAGISADIPIHITENGWPTSPQRPEKKQADVLQEVIQAVYAERQVFNVQAYELFSLRDADSSNADIFHQFGILKDDYTPKVAFNVFRELIARFGT